MSVTGTITTSSFQSIGLSSRVPGGPYGPTGLIGQGDRDKPGLKGRPGAWPGTQHEAAAELAARERPQFDGSVGEPEFRHVPGPVGRHDASVWFEPRRVPDQ